MLGNFNFLSEKEIFEKFSSACIEAEKSILVSPATTAILSRRALELAVKWLYSFDDDLKHLQAEVKKLGISKIFKLVNSHDEFERIYDKFNDWNKEKSFIVSKNSPNIIGHITATSHGDDTDRERLDRIFVLK